LRVDIDVIDLLINFSKEAQILQQCSWIFFEHPLGESIVLKIDGLRVDFFDNVKRILLQNDEILIIGH
jgi:hypothetical protein